jgi:hypothetical protein
MKSQDAAKTAAAGSSLKLLKPAGNNESATSYRFFTVYGQPQNKQSPLNPLIDVRPSI